MPIVDKAVELGEQVIEHSGLGAKAAEVLQGATARIMEEVGLTRAPRYVAEDLKGSFVHGGLEPRRPVDLADDPGRGAIVKGPKVIMDVPAKVVPGETFDYATGVDQPQPRTRIKQIVENWARLDWEPNTNSVSNVVARARLSTGDVASITSGGTMRLMTKEGYAGEVYLDPKDPSKIGSIRLSGPDIKASEPEFAFARGESPSLNVIRSGDKFAAKSVRAEPTSAGLDAGPAGQYVDTRVADGVSAESVVSLKSLEPTAASAGARPSGVAAEKIAETGEPKASTVVADRASTDAAPTTAAVAADSAPQPLRGFAGEEADRSLADVVRGVARDGERLARTNGGKNGFVRVIKNADGTFDATFEGGPLQGTTAVWGRPEEGILLQRGDYLSHVGWHPPSRTTAGMIDPRVRWVEGR